MAKKKEKNISISGGKKESKVKKVVNKENDKKNKDLQLKKVKLKIKKRYVEKQYSSDTLKKALTAIGNGQTFRQASRLFGIPKATLHAKLNNYMPIECDKGAPTILSKQEENEIVEWILFCAEKGFPITKHRLLDCVQELMIAEKRKNPFKDNRPGKHWYKGFMNRHENLSKSMAQNVTPPTASTPENDCKAWFQSVKEYLIKKNLLNLSSDRIFYLDKLAFMSVPEDNSVITRKGIKIEYQIAEDNDKACLTVHFTAAASGDMPPPMILYDLKTHSKKSVVKDIPEEWGVGHTDNGLMTAETFYDYVVNVFYKWLLSKKLQFPIALYIEGHSSHLTLQLTKFCKKAGIEIITLNSNATHFIQPLDVALFHPLKEAYKKTLRTRRKENGIVGFKKLTFPKVLKLALDSIYPSLKTALISGFRACGLFPFDENVVDYDIFNKKAEKNVPSSFSSNGDGTTTINNHLQLLHLFETTVTTTDILKEFVNNESEESWKGDPKQKGLFEFWWKLRKLCENEGNNTSGAVNESNDSSEDSAEDNSEVLASFNNSLYNLSDLSDSSLSRVINMELIEENSLSDDQIPIQSKKRIHTINNDCFGNIEHHLPVIKMTSDTRLHSINAEYDHIYSEFSDLTTKDLFNISKTMNSTNELNEIEFPL